MLSELMDLLIELSTRYKNGSLAFVFLLMKQITTLITTRTVAFPLTKMILQKG